ncbi:MAG: DUF364 domain-containing protein [Kiritimatiellales bacterium]
MRALKTALHDLAEDCALLDDPVLIECSALSVEEALGRPVEQDYPIQRGREVMIQAVFRESVGQAFSRETVCRTFSLREVLALPMKSDWQRAVLTASANAVFAEAGLIDRTVHCKGQGPAECARCLHEITQNEKVALFGLQPRFLEELKRLREVRCVDIDPDLIGTSSSGVIIELPEKTDELMKWADRLLVTGSATVNNTFGRFLEARKPLHVFGTTGAAMAYVLGLQRCCKADAIAGDAESH